MMNNRAKAYCTYAYLAICYIFLVITHSNCASRIAKTSSKRPNIIWIIPDDMSANFSCYGEKAIQTPHVDSLAARGIRFTNAYVTAPVCSPCRSAFITGMYQTTIGSHHHRSGRGVRKIELPRGVQLVPQLFKNAGYFTTLSGWPIRADRLGKSDYNFEWDTAVYDGSDWLHRREGQPFFAQIQTPGGKLRGAHPEQWDKVCGQAVERLGSETPLEVVDLPPYYPPDPDIVKDWQAYLESVRLTDAMLGEVMERLQAEGVLDNTYVLFMTDHGISHARGKQFLYDEGIHVPLIIAGPDIPSGSIREDLVEHIDIAALSLGLAGIEVPKIMQGQDILAPDYIPRDAVFAARDRCDETVDHIRSVRTQNFKYIRNFLPNRPYLQPNAYKDAKAILIALRRCRLGGELDPVQMLHFSQSRPVEELYDMRTDPYEIQNLAEDPDHKDILLAMRKRLGGWMEETNDKGREPESREMYDSDMALYLDRLRGRYPKRLQVIEENIALMKKWSIEGR